MRFLVSFFLVSVFSSILVSTRPKTLLYFKNGFAVIPHSVSAALWECQKRNDSRISLMFKLFSHKTGLILSINLSNDSFILPENEVFENSINFVTCVEILTSKMPRSATDLSRCSNSYFRLST